MTTDWYVEIVDGDDNVIKRLGPMTEREADRVENGMNINLDHERFYTRRVSAKEDSDKLTVGLNQEDRTDP